MVKKISRVCVIIPAYNEGLVINEVIKSAEKTFATGHQHIDIVVVNDGSSDNTSTEAKRAGAIVIDHVLNSGAGSATATGLSYAEKNGYTVAATMDADGQHAPEDVLNGIEIILKQNSDLLIGSRLIDSSGMSRVKVLGNKGLSFVTFALFGIHSTDSQSGLRIYGPRALKELQWKTSGYEFCSEMLWRAHQLKLKIDEYPIKAIYTDYSKSKGQNNWNAINIVSSLLRQRLGELFE
ncbi:MAG: glycosyltransferase family 2 protein [Candidatus Saccharimonadaceae bacterium]